MTRSAPLSPSAPQDASVARAPLARARPSRARPSRARLSGTRLAGAFLASALLAASLAGSPLQAQEKADYYYPPITSEETFDRHMLKGGPADAATRETFVTMITVKQIGDDPSPRYALFAKGDGSKQLIMVGLQDGPFRSLYRARAIMAQITSQLRSAEYFKDQGVESTATFFDVCQLLGFENLTISNGVDWTHRVNFE